MTPVEMLFVYGPRRSGTNYLNQLLLQNTAYTIASLDKKPSAMSLVNPRISIGSEIFGSKHSLDDVEYLAKFPHYGFYFFVFKPVEEWIFSRINYQKRMNLYHDAEYKFFVNKVMHDEYFSFLKSLRLKINDSVFHERFLIFDYNRLTPSYLIHSLQNKGLRCAAEGLDCLREATPGGGLGAVFDREYSHALHSGGEYYNEIFLLAKSSIHNLEALDADFYRRIFFDSSVNDLNYG